MNVEISVKLNGIPVFEHDFDVPDKVFEMVKYKKQVKIKIEG